VAPLISTTIALHRPEAVALVAAASAAARDTLGPQRYSSSSVSIAAVTGEHSRLADPSARDAWSAFADQFVLDVTGLRDQPSVYPDMTAAEWKVLVTALYVHECTSRLCVMADALLDGSPVAMPDVPCPSDLRQTWQAYQNCVMTGQALDPLVTEAVRLRCARTHDCRICQTLRLADARQAGVDSSVTDLIDRYESSDLPDRVKVALRITDAFISRPDLLDPDVIDQARTTFSEEQLVELLLDITKWSTQKVNVATGTDGIDALPLNDEGIAFLTFATDGSTRPFSRTVS
jgi:hypothetical protein